MACKFYPHWLVLWALGAAVWLGGCGKPEVEPIRFGTDSCAHCKMTIIDPKFGAALLTTTGKTYKFDDVNCLSMYLESGSPGADMVASLWIVDFGAPREYVAAENAYLIISEKIRSPMASQTAAFSDPHRRDAQLQVWGGEVLDWKTAHKRFLE